MARRIGTRYPAWPWASDSWLCSASRFTSDSSRRRARLMNFRGLLTHQQYSEGNHQQAFEEDKTGDELTSNRTRF